MIKALKIVFSIVTIWGVVVLFFACDDTPSVKEKTRSSVVKKEIIMPPKAPKETVPTLETKSGKPVGKSEKPAPMAVEKTSGPSEKGKDDKVDVSDLQKKAMAVLGPEDLQKGDHYDAKGKIDPFKPLILERAVERPVEKAGESQRILTPLEKIDLSQIRLVAVIQLKDKKIAMVEEASGKGYEVGVGTYIGKNQGRISDIKSSSIQIKELVRDYKGRIKEKVREMKLNKLSDGE